MNRVEALEQIVTFGPSRERAYSELVKYGYDPEAERFVVSKSVLASILSKYLCDQITADELEEWSNFVECRDDLDYQAVEDYIYSLADPVLLGEITKTKIEIMVQVLQGK